MFEAGQAAAAWSFRKLVTRSWKTSSSPISFKFLIILYAFQVEGADVTKEAAHGRLKRCAGGGVGPRSVGDDVERRLSRNSQQPSQPPETNKVATSSTECEDTRGRVSPNNHRPAPSRTDGPTEACPLPSVRLDAVQIYLRRLCRPLAAENPSFSSVLGSSPPFRLAAAPSHATSSTKVDSDPPPLVCSLSRKILT